MKVAAEHFTNKIPVSSKYRVFFAEAAGLAIFMISACFFSAMIDGDTSWHRAIPDADYRRIVTGALMGLTALFIFYLPFTASSGAHINPAVTIAFLWLKRLSVRDGLVYISGQIFGGTAGVFIMALLLDELLAAPPVNYVVTVPLGSTAKALGAEFLIGFFMMTVVLSTSAHRQLKSFTRIIAACLVTIFVVTAGPISGFGMNPARSFASAVAANIWTGFWIYVIAPIGSMLMAAEISRRVAAKKRDSACISIQVRQQKVLNKI
jgi:aquaporin Z